MFRPASRIIARSTAARTFPRVAAPHTRRFLSTAPPTQKSRSWKSMVARFGIAGAIIYYYNTTDVFAEEPRHLVQPLPETEEETEQLQTIDALAKERQQRRAGTTTAEKTASEGARETAAAGGMEGVEEEADQQGAFNPETGEINWDCACLGGMAHGPCGEEFKAAFSCFMFSTEEPKGMDCIDKFKGMQSCFREYPEIYGAELDTDDEDDVTADRDQPLAATETAHSKPTSGSAPSEPSAENERVGPAAPKQSEEPSSDRYAKQERAQAATEQVRQEHGDSKKKYVGPAKVEKPMDSNADHEGKQQRAKAATNQVKKEHEPVSESESVIPKASHDETAANQEKE